MPVAEYPRILTAGDSGMVVEFGNAIDPDINRKVYRFAAAVADAAIGGVVELVPAYRSALIHYDPLELTAPELHRAVEQILRRAAAGEESGAGAVSCFEIPVAYGGAHGPDLERVAEQAGISAEQVIQLHAGRVYRVYMLGFLPGFPYLGGMDPAIKCPRLDTPRVRVPAGSVGIAEEQTGVYPIESPGGWNLIGRTPVPLFDPAADPPVAIAPGGLVRFNPVDAGELRAIQEEIDAGVYSIPVETVLS